MRSDDERVGPNVGTDRGAAPMLGHVLLVGIAIVIGVTVTVFALGITEQVGSSPPMATFQTEYATDNGLVVQHRSGERLDPRQLSIRVDGRSYPAAEFLTGDRVGAGTTIGPLYPGDGNARLVWEQDGRSEILYTAKGPREGAVPSYVRFDARETRSYGSGQDDDAEFTVTAGGRNGHLVNNTWKLIDFEYNITENTVLEFDFRSTREGEIHGIGLETDDSISSNRVFRLFGNQSWGLEYDDVDYEAGDGWVHYEIPIGELYGPSQHGQAEYLALVNDIDDTDITTDSQFRNVRAHEAPDLGSSIQFELSVDGTTTTEPVRSYGSQDKDYGVTTSDGNATMGLTGNTWTSVPINKTVTEDTVVSVEFNATSEGEIHGIGLETDESETESRFVRFYGNQSWADKITSSSTGSDGWATYEIDASTLVPSGEDVTHLVFVNDDDTGGNGVSRFRNVTISEE